jgi:hypothetical protein
MPIRVSKVYVCVDGVFVADGPKPNTDDGGRGLVLGTLTSMNEHPRQDGPAWSIELTAGKGAAARTIPLPLERFLSADEHRQSFDSPLCTERLATNPKRDEGSPTVPTRRIWLYRDAFYVTDRSPKASELDEVTLRIKALYFQDDLALKRLREQVANFEAIGRVSGDKAGRQSIPDDVKLLVWSRDGAACVRCRATVDLHFDHIIPLSRGGGDHAENIQLLCRSCNLSKGSRLT